MKEIKLDLMQEEMESLNKGDGRPVEIYDDGETKVIINYSK